jgi:hypothetical protein
VIARSLEVAYDSDVREAGELIAVDPIEAAGVRHRPIGMMVSAERCRRA